LTNQRLDLASQRHFAWPPLGGKVPAAFDFSYDVVNRRASEPLVPIPRVVAAGRSIQPEKTS
jgi:hypothetical protein